MKSLELSIIVPTYNEVKNISRLIHGIFLEFKKSKINGEVIVVDDNSKDGTREVLNSLKNKNRNLVLIYREGKLGLSSAVLDGFKKSRSKVVGVMDGDLSHPTDKIPKMFDLIKSGKADFVVGSRYVKGGKILGWGMLRKILSRGATILAKPFTPVRDPMTGFFILRRELVDYKELNPHGFKILLELLVKTNPKKIVEVPIIFTNRVEGKSKAGFKEIFFYLQNLIGYKKHLRPSYKEFFKYAVVGFTGSILNLFFLWFFTTVIGLFYLWSGVFSFIIAVINNYLLNKVWTFGESFREKIFSKGVMFLIVNLGGLFINLFFLWFFTTVIGFFYLISEIFAIVLATFWNFLGNKFWTFR